MKDTVKTRFNFFQVCYEEKSMKRLPELLQSLQEIPLEQRQLDIYRTPRFLSDEQERTSWGSAFLFTTKRMKGIPFKIKEDNSRESLYLEENEGLAEDVAMSCDPTGSIIALQQNRYSMSEGIVTSYLLGMCPDNPIKFRPILTVDSLQRFCTAQQIRRLHIKLAGPLDFTFLRQLGLSNDQKIVLQHMMSAPTVDIAWSAVREKEGLGDSLKKLGKILKEYFIQGGSSHVLSLDAVIRNSINDSIETEPIDLLTDRIYYLADIPMSPNKETNNKALLEAACDALRNKKDELAPFIQKGTS